MVDAWMPEGASWAVTAAFALVLVVHVRHMVVMRGRHRLWHSVHVLMAVGMIAMVWPAGGGMVVPVGPGVAVYVAAASVLAIALVVARGRGVRLGWLWAVAVVDLALMAVMFALMVAPSVWVAVPAAAWFLLQTAGWAGGQLGRVLESHGLGEPRPAVLPRARPVRAVGSAGTATIAEPVAPAPAPAAPVVDGGPQDWSVRITLAIMSLGMAAMLLAMTFGPTSMAPGMPGM